MTRDVVLTVLLPPKSICTTRKLQVTTYKVEREEEHQSAQVLLPELFSVISSSSVRSIGVSYQLVYCISPNNSIFIVYVYVFDSTVINRANSVLEKGQSCREAPSKRPSVAKSS